MSKDEANTARQYYLDKFKLDNKPDSIFGVGCEHTGKEIVALMKKEDLTYEQAYASLQYAYNLIRYQSNFLKLG